MAEMTELEKARLEIDAVDKEIAALFTRRMQAVEKVAAYKKQNGLPVYDADREAQMLARERAWVPEEYSSYYETVLSALMDASKAYQRDSADFAGITVKSGALSDVGSYFNLNRRVLVVTDDGVPAQYAGAVCSACREAHLVTIPAGERSKNLDNWKMLLRTMTAAGFTRGDAVVSVGGGVCGDLAGFAAACYMRGIDYYQVPTTLLCQIDASVGGKVAVDFDDCKNTVGAFYPARRVLIDPDVLDTLPPRQYAAGMAEAIKVFAVWDRETFEQLERQGKGMPVEAVIRAALRCKLDVVRRDPREQDLRRVLNFGHTVGHAMEAVSLAGNQPLLHGECVALGMLCVSDGTVRARLEKLLGAFGLPTAVSLPVAASALTEKLQLDKKGDGAAITVVTVPQIGTYALEKMTPAQLLAKTQESGVITLL